MKIQDIISLLEKKASPTLQEEYDNAGLLTGDRNWACTGAMVSLDATEEVIADALNKGCNLLVCHHPIVFKGLKKINGSNYVERAIIAAIKGDLAIYAIHTNLDNVIDGVNGRIADKFHLKNRQVLLPKAGLLKQLSLYVPLAHAEPVRQAIFAAGGGEIGAYDECSFSVNGLGTFRAGDNARPFVGENGLRHTEEETRLELIFPVFREKAILQAMRAAHPYEEVAYQLLSLDNSWQAVGSGLIGELPEPLAAKDLLALTAAAFGTGVIRHSKDNGKMIQKLAVCGGAGSFLTRTALAAGADAFLTADLKYHEFFDAEDRILLADIGHFESEQHSVDLLAELLSQNFPNFAVLKTGVNSNPVHYFFR